MRNYKFRLYPNQFQEKRLQDTLLACCWTYNYFVRLTREGFLSRNDMCYALVEFKEQNTWLRNYHSKMLQMVTNTLANSQKAIIALRRKGYKTGDLRLKRPTNFKSFTYNQSGFRLERHGGTDLLWLSKIGCVEIRLHRNIGNIKQVTVIHQAGKWYAIICSETFCKIPNMIDFSKSVGIDVGIKNFVYDSKNNVVHKPKHLQNLSKKLTRIQRKLSRRKKGSNNYKKALKWYQVVHQKIVNRRKDFLHKVSKEYAKNYDVIFIENLKPKNMVKNHRLAKSIVDSSWSTFKNMLDYKSRLLVEVNAVNTSIECFRCEKKIPKNLAIRIHRCDVCGLVIDRDYNASLNILKRGLKIFGKDFDSKLPQELREVTPVEISKRSVKQEATILSLNI